MGKILRIGYRQIDAIRTQVVSALAGQCAYALSFSLSQWLEERNELRHETSLAHGESTIPRYAPQISFAMGECLKTAVCKESHWQAYLDTQREPTKRTGHENEDVHGTNYAGGWDTDSFILRSGIILTLGSLDDFERGVIRLCLNQHEQPYSEGDFWEPDLRDFLSYSPASCIFAETAEIQRPNGRKRILKKFGIHFPSNEPWVQRLSNARKNRNQFAHGEELRKLKLSDFVLVHYDAFCCMHYLAEDCLKKCGIRL